MGIYATILPTAIFSFSTPVPAQENYPSQEEKIKALPKKLRGVATGNNAKKEQARLFLNAAEARARKASKKKK